MHDVAGCQQRPSTGALRCEDKRGTLAGATPPTTALAGRLGARRRALHLGAKVPRFQSYQGTSTEA